LARLALKKAQTKGTIFSKPTITLKKPDRKNFRLNTSCDLP